ncbi:MAG: hypothetical protein D6832_04885 [Alphaproteobacteria bacterium]|nr:MAG: hypothetical protein D6832_04885 [Alphaproteobacteria bacterium]
MWSLRSGARPARTVLPRRALLGALAAGALLAGCRARPLLAPGGSAARLRGQVAIAQIEGETGFALEQALVRELGPAGADAPFVLRVSLSTAERRIGTTATGGTTRVQLSGTARWALLRRGAEDGPEAAAGVAEALVSYDTTGTRPADEAAARDAGERLAALLARRIAERIRVGADALGG